VQDGGDADVGAEVLGVGRNGGERIGCGREQQSVDLGLVLVGDGTEGGRQREHHVEHGPAAVRLRAPQAMPARPALALRAVPVAAGVVGDAGVGAVLATLDMTAQRGGTQTSIAVMTRRCGELRCAVLTARQAARGSGRYPPLRASDATLPARQSGASLPGSGGRAALDLPDQVDGNAGRAHGRLDVPMSKQVLDDANVDTLFEQMGRKTVSQRVDGDDLLRPAASRRAGRPVAARAWSSAAMDCDRKPPVRRARRRQ